MLDEEKNFEGIEEVCGDIEIIDEIELNTNFGITTSISAPLGQ